AYNNGNAGIGATLTSAGAQTNMMIDGVELQLSDRVLVKDQSNEAQNGIYFVSNVGSSITNWVLTRALDYDEPNEIVQYGTVLVNQGTMNAGTLFFETEEGPFTIGTTPIDFED